MAVTKGKSGKGEIGVPLSLSNNRSRTKVTCIGHSTNTRFNSKNDKRNKKKYRGQGK